VQRRRNTETWRLDQSARQSTCSSVIARRLSDLVIGGVTALQLGQFLHMSVKSDLFS
jgi:hypothetical protein